VQLHRRVEGVFDKNEQDRKAGKQRVQRKMPGDPAAERRAVMGRLARRNLPVGS